MKMKAFAIGLLAAGSLVACQAEEDAGDNGNNNGVENTNFERSAEDMAQNGQDANQNDNGRDTAQNTNYKIAKDAANRIEKNVEGVDQVYVLKTRDNAYVAAELDNPRGDKNEVSDEMEQQIKKAVKASDQDINNVYISTNPDFVDLTNNYIENTRNGEPVSGFFREFGEMVDRIFPDQRS
ncbi:sporulation lipoprotein, YhcN/YlaJ family [Halobacillus karajensis]|uniref:Lipoprotein YhcN n=1 Tax=Halobacillus karajensis TaxID=195088 RepID=A0A024P7N0_9BACI|nr:YhcN/YlaJ family sporulation lipoprotein [Halobacillus karajensis]CDQ21168.1 Lipoprotein YhcN precursor [Halobacillus karajensis]CDQ24768.1 Lipoprotein YhcN precursor [Halobacillus karajensis]CDQ28872.1 Lipoprotein YhcN precursor [Halobacillus karajensis]SEH95359.1 sporulation lipoprotein, YhcN/YlaJ family [Halobacillus karajensis]